jgi:hypothetical protein
MRWPRCNDGDMEASKVRVRRSVAEKRRIVELTLQQGQSVARVGTQDAYDGCGILLIEFDRIHEYLLAWLQLASG